MKHSTLLLLFFALVSSLPAQENLVLREVAQLPAGTSSLLLPDSELRGKIMESEQAIDLVHAWVLDSILDKKRQRLAGPGGWMAQRLGSRYWQYLDSTKRKYVGTMSRHFKIYDGMGDEYDLNIFLMPHLPQYVDMVWDGFQVALKRPRGKGAFRFDEPEDYPCPEKLKFEDRGYITVECEGTPDHDYHQRLTEVFLPMGKGTHDLSDWPQTGLEYPSFGMYGTWCLDCNHNCRPEIHPFEWLWWLDMSEDRPGSPQAKSWMLSAMRDDSRRFPDWSSKPLDGLISIPVVIPAHAASCTVTLENLLVDNLFPLPSQGLAAWKSNEPQKVVASSADGKRTVTLDYLQEGLDVGSGIPLWWSDFTVEAGTGKVMGYLNLRMSVETIWAGRLTVDYR